jgi:hypothetical protein
MSALSSMDAVKVQAKSELRCNTWFTVSAIGMLMKLSLSSFAQMDQGIIAGVVQKSTHLGRLRRLTP